MLLDELGGGTDPIAGAALAQSILEKILSSDPSCKIVATTHSPELKSLSLTDARFQCACVLLDSEPRDFNTEIANYERTAYLRKPNYQLRYGSSGESYALGAASRCTPRLPDEVISRAAQLMANDDSGDILNKHLLALDREKVATNAARKEAEEIHMELRILRDDTIAKLQSSDLYLSRLERRLAAMFETLRKDESRNAFELVGESLSELRLMRTKVRSEEDLLAEKGLRRVPENYSFYDGESLVIIAEGEFKGYTAVVKLDSENINEYVSTVTVIPTLDLFMSDEEGAPLLELKRTDVAIWDYPDALFGERSSESKTRRPGSSKKVLSLLSGLNVDNSKTSKCKDQVDKPNDSFTSARQRRKAKKGKKKK